MPDSDLYDVIVIGGGPAGLAASLWLARYRHRVRMFDASDPRNKETWAVHGYFGISDPAPLELRGIGREQAEKAGAEVSDGVVESVGGEKDGFWVKLADGGEFRSRRLLFATGLKDIKPEIQGFDDFYGSSIWHCPDCDGPSITGLKVGVIGWGKGIAKYALYMLTWTDKLTVLTHSHDADMEPDALTSLAEGGIALRSEAVTALEGRDGLLERVQFHDGTSEPFDALFFHIASGPGSTLPSDMGCEPEEDAVMEGLLKVDRDFETTVPGVYAAGDITPGTRLAIRAAYEGTRAAIGIHKSLIGPEQKIG